MAGSSDLATRIVRDYRAQGARRARELGSLALEGALANRRDEVTLSELFEDPYVSSLQKHVIVNKIISWAARRRFEDGDTNWTCRIATEAKLWDDDRQFRLTGKHRWDYQTLVKGVL